MAQNIDEFIAKYDLKRFSGRGQETIDLVGADSYEDLITDVDREEDLDDLKTAGFQPLVIRKLFKAILSERQARSKPQILETALSTLVEDVVKEPKPYVAKSVFRSKKHEPKAVAKQQQATRGNEWEVPGAKPAARQQVELPDPMGPGPLLGFKRHEKKAENDEAAEVQAPFQLSQAFADAPALPAPGQMSASAQAASKACSGRQASERALAKRKEEEAQADTLAANAGLMADMVKGNKVELPSKMFDRTLDFSWSKKVSHVDMGKREYDDAPISKLDEEEFKKEFLAALKAFVAGYQDWDMPEIDAWLVYDPYPAMRYYGGHPDPHVMITFKHVEDAEAIRYEYKQPHPDAPPFLTIKGQVLKVERPDPKKVQRAHSDMASETVSQAGSTNSHDSRAGGATQRNMTLLFQNLPESMTKNTTELPQVRSKVSKYVEEVLASQGGLPIDKAAIKFVASFSEPRRAPQGGMWVTFSYKLENHRIVTGVRGLEDGRAYTLEAFKSAYRKSGASEKSERDLENLWARCDHAVTAAEKLLGGRNRPRSIAKFFMDRVRAMDQPKKEAALKKKEKNEEVSMEERQKYIEGGRRTWTELTIGGHPLSIDWMHMRAS